MDRTPSESKHLSHPAGGYSVEGAGTSPEAAGTLESESFLMGYVFRLEESHKPQVLKHIGRLTRADKDA
jgi:hypothetical protein